MPGDRAGEEIASGGLAGPPPLAELRVLVVEDETVIALLIEDMLDELGCRLAASLGTLEEALAVAGSIAADVALLDVNLAGEVIFPVAERLQARGVAVVFATGYGSAGLPAPWRGHPVLAKPFALDELREALAAAIAARGAD